MYFIMRRKGLFFLLLFGSCLAFGQVEQYDIQLDNKVYADGIASVQLAVGPNQLSKPVGTLGVDEFHISFDDLESETRHLK